VAWVIGARVRRVMAESPGRWSGDDLVTVGYVLGIIGTVLCVIGALVFITFFSAVFSVGAGL